MWRHYRAANSLSAQSGSVLVLAGAPIYRKVSVGNHDAVTHPPVCHLSEGNAKQPADYITIVVLDVSHDKF